MDSQKPGWILRNIEKLDPYVVSDYHLLKELNTLSTDRHTDKIVKMHNKHIRKNDYVLFLGDLTESEFFNRYNCDVVMHVGEITKKLNGKKIMISGNNDVGDKVYYRQICGFVEFYRNINVETEHFIFSHTPYDNSAVDKLNVHGHNHGSKNYFGVSTENHIDVYHQLWDNVPRRLSEFKWLYATGTYYGLRGFPDRKRENNYPVLHIW